jgi:hypothetical protein
MTISNSYRAPWRPICRDPGKPSPPSSRRDSVDGVRPVRVALSPPPGPAAYSGRNEPAFARHSRARRREPSRGPPVTLGHLRSHGRRRLLIYCSTGSAITAQWSMPNRWPDEIALRDLCPKAVCTRCGIRRRRRAAGLDTTTAEGEPDWRAVALSYDDLLLLVSRSVPAWPNCNAGQNKRALPKLGLEKAFWLSEHRSAGKLGDAGGPDRRGVYRGDTGRRPRPHLSLGERRVDFSPSCWAVTRPPEMAAFSLVKDP